MSASVNGETRRSGNPRAIVRISAKGLFGQFDYELPAKDAPAQDLRSLFVLYGDNGAGKTTLLRLTYHLLSAEPEKGYKAAIGKVRFQRFAVELADGTVVEALRTGKADNGPYRAAILKDGATLDAIEFAANERGADDEAPGSHELRFLKRLKTLGLALRLVSDDRRVSDEEPCEGDRAIRNSFFHYLSTPRDNLLLPVLDRHRPSPVKQAAARANRWIERQADKGSRLGQSSVHSIYIEIAQRIAASAAPPDPASELADRSAFLVKLESLSQRSNSYGRFGLVSDLPVKGLVKAIQGAPADAWPVLHKVMNPYADGIKASLDALSGIYELLLGFIDNIGLFLGGGKRILFDIRHGFSMLTRKGEPLDLDLLSSGEKQLLLLLFNTLSARDEATILLIDEPEISLNIKWQRLLVPALLNCIRGSDAQLVFATHSIELLAQHMGNVVKLADRSEAEEAPDEPGREIEEDSRGGRAVQA